MSEKIKEEILNKVDFMISCLNKLKQDIMDYNALVSKTATVGLIRWIGILSDISAAEGSVSIDELSKICIKWGKNTHDIVKYFIGNNLSLISYAKVDDGRMILTCEGCTKIDQFEENFGSNWLTKIDMEIISNPLTFDDSEITLKG